MEMITSLQINNYKSIKQLNLDCRRINVLIGEPNAGKSNILEALDLSYLSWMMATNESFEKAGKEKIDIKSFFRARKVSDLFHLGDVSKAISISHPGFSTNAFSLSFKNEEDINRIDAPANIFEWNPGHAGVATQFNNDFEPVTNAQFYSSPIKPYKFKQNIQYHDTGNYLNKAMPPFINNFKEVIKHNPSFEDLAKLFAEHGIEINIDLASEELLIQLRIKEGLVYSLPYSSIADTLQRIIFYVTAIRYNNGRVITLEEPDTHAFPKFVSFLADEIIEKSKTQFFIATHNPYLLNNLIENTLENELSIFVCHRDKNEGTKAKRLSSEDLSELLDYGVDIFFNLNRYLDDRVEHTS